MKYVVYGAMALAAFMLQSGVLPQFPLLGIEVDVLTPVIAMVALFGGLTVGMTSAVLCGLGLDLLFSHAIGYYSFPLALVALVCGLLQRSHVHESLLVAPIAGGGGYLLKELISLVAALLMSHAVGAGYTLYRYVLPGTLIAAVLTTVLFIGMIYLHRLRFMQPSRSRDVDDLPPLGKGYLRG